MSKRSQLTAGIALLFVGLLACDARTQREAPGTLADARPNVLWVVWDTVRADHMSVYGYARPTTPFLEEWAEGARVFENVVSAGSTTVPSHASMFTGLLPSAHGADNRQTLLDARFETIAERLRARGYATYLFSANPHIRAQSQLTRGFGVAEHPWSPRYREAAGRLGRDKTRLYEEGAAPDPKSVGHFKAGPLTRKALERWLSARDPGKPFFVFLNYMEAHTPLLPERRYRERFMSADQLGRSYTSGFTALPAWNYTAGLGEIGDDDIDLIRRTYDAALAELDDLFRDLIGFLERAGHLDDTVVILTSDHGELLGEHHMLNHQFSLHREVLNVPLIVHYPPRLPPGRDDRPVMNQDLFPMLSELTETEADVPDSHQAVSLLRPLDARVRLAEYPSSARNILALVALTNSGFDPTPLERTLRALYLGDYKYVWASDGRHELYDVRRDERERHNLLATRGELATSLERELERRFGAPRAPRAERVPPEPSQEVKEMLGVLGYAEPGGATPAGP